jgi:hypothetical protein
LAIGKCHATGSALRAVTTASAHVQRRHRGPVSSISALGWAKRSRPTLAFWPLRTAGRRSTVELALG